ncbi:major royal jelly family protein [Pendulispora brunnea]|uniref:Major royal jelly family protein n=1 Tax=Pendulispora brunnea TaxID=2905690 RepID=A0ABZ2JYA7_9BACT
MRTNRYGNFAALALASSAGIFVAACARSDETPAPSGKPDAEHATPSSERDAERETPFGKAEVMHSWTRMDWFWRTAAERQSYQSGGAYKAATLAGVDIDRKGHVYVTTPRWLDKGVPSTLNQVVSVYGKSVLLPFPTWDDNAVGDAAARFQNVLGVEVDSANRMWILDMGWVAGMEPTPDGAQKLVVLDLNTATELKRYAIPDSVANRNTSFLNDLVIDEKRELAFITDSGNRAGSPTASGIIVYDFKANTARRILNHHRSVQDDPTRELTVMGERVLPSGRLAVGINGIALSPDGSTLYWNVTTGDAIYSAKVDALLDPTATPAQIDQAIIGPKRIGGGSDGMSADAKGRIYFTNLAAGKVQYFGPQSENVETIAEGPGTEWPDSLTWDDRGGLWFSSNWLNRAFAGQMNFEQGTPNFRIWRIQTDSSKAFVK